MIASRGIPGGVQQPVGRLALGTVQFGLAYGVANQHGQVHRGDARKMVELAAAAGVDTIDTAMGYGDSESCLGEIGMAGFKLVTKLPAMPIGTTDVSDWVNGQIGASFARLAVSRVHGLLLHRPLDLLGANGGRLYDALCRLKEASLVQKIGVSIYSPEELDQLTAKYRLDLVQAPFSLVDRRLHASGWLRRLKDRGIEIHTRSTFLQGLLLMPREAMPAKFARWNVLWGNWQQWLESHQETAVHACLAFPLSFPEIDRVLVGADSTDQLRQTLAAATRASPSAMPDLSCEEEELINPANWPNL